jgi:hypothetical protein
MKQTLKQTFLFVALLICANSVNAQWTTSGNNIYNSNSGNVGIGTSTPQKKLDVVTGSNSYASVGHGIVIGQFAGLHFGYLETGNSGYRKSALVFERVDNASRGKIHILNNAGFDSNSAGLGDARMTIDFSGNVGIGATSPKTRLDLGELRFDAITSLPAEGSILETNWGNYIVGNVNSLQQIRLGVSNDGYSRAEIDLDNGNRADGTIAFKTTTSNGGALTRMFVRGDGYIGINTTNPESPLTLDGAVAELNMLVRNTSANGARTYISAFPGKSSIQTDKDFTIRTNGGGWTDKFILTNAGNVGIGTTTPGSYKLAVEGKIGAREVNVTTAAWSDYVFHADYKLRPLSEVQQYIEENHHLPEVPSEKEVLANGQNLGEMNVVLLKKIEELTLYVIELNKEIKSLKSIKDNSTDQK